LCLDTGAIEMALDMAGSVWRFWMFAGQMDEARRWLEEVTTHPDASRFPSPLARALGALGSVTYWQNDFETTRIHYERALEILRTLDEPPAFAEALYNLAFLETVEQNFETARGYHLEARSVYRTIGDARGVANTAVGMGIADSLTGNYDEALQFAKEAHEFFDPQQDWFGMMMAAFIQYQVLRFQGRFQEAWDTMVQTFQNTYQGLDPSSVSSMLESIADVAVEVGKAELAVRLAGTGARMKDALGAEAPRALVRVEDPRPRARAFLSDDEIETLFREGGEMTPQDALKLALKDEG
jgi:tetratricopeptide (TPR) repeat protein